MKRNTLKLLAFASAVSLGFGITNNSFAETETVAVALITNSAITIASGDDMDFGTWALLHPATGGTNDVTLTLNATTGAVVASGIGGLSAATEIVAASQPGSLTVTTPAAATLNVFGNVSNAITAEAGLTLSLPFFSYAGGGITALPAATGTATAAATGGADSVTFGAAILVTATPADATHAGELSVTFTY
ncbi:MAG: hypothetical protein COB36_01755 [Alphaproteobacteria bacterium]|nr:MAG: hypothetical protein COB36_01755 [Alphaproteobacteria bacterium]